MENENIKKEKTLNQMISIGDTLENTPLSRSIEHGLLTGFPVLDKLAAGMMPGQLIFLASRPAMGKSALALNIIQNICRDSNKSVAIFSYEMMAQELSMRMLAQNTKLETKKLREKSYTDQDCKTLAQGIQSLSSYSLQISEDSRVNLTDIRSQCRKMKRESGLDLIVVDYIQLVEPEKFTAREQQISELTRGLKSIARELECPVLALSQVNRGVEARPNKRPECSDLRESGSIEQDADGIWFVYRDEFYHKDSHEKGIAEIIVAKSRGGSTGTALLKYNSAYSSFESMDT